MHDIMVRSLPQGCRLTAIFDSVRPSQRLPAHPLTPCAQCHSGSALDLPYIYSTQGKLKEPNLLADAGQGVLGAAKSYMRGDLGGVFSSLTGVGKKVMGGGGNNQAAVRAVKMSNADCISWSGCKDTQTSADTSEAGKATGAMSFAFISALSASPFHYFGRSSRNSDAQRSQPSTPSKPTCTRPSASILPAGLTHARRQLLNTIRDELKGRYDQKPQVCALAVPPEPRLLLTSPSQLSCSHELDCNLLAIF